MNTQMLKGILDWCVLRLVKEEPLFSQEIIAGLSAAGFGAISEGTMFPLLLRLEKEGLVDSEKKDNPLGASRKYYHMNDRGRRALEDFTKEWRTFAAGVDQILGDK